MYPAFPAVLRSAIARRERPNLLFLWTDQQRADTLACYGNSRVQAPNLNALAAQSTVFDRAYVAQPVCTPSRSAVMTGRWPHQTGCTGNNIALPRDARCFPELLRDRSDYATMYIGKWHLWANELGHHDETREVGRVEATVPFRNVRWRASDRVLELPAFLQVDG